MKKIDLSIYPTSSEINALFYLDLAKQLRWKTYHLSSKPGDIVTLHKDNGTRCRVRFWSNKNEQFHLLSAAVIVWAIIKGELPSENGIFSLNGNNADLSPANWTEQNWTPPEIHGGNIKEYVHFNRETGVFTWRCRTPRNSNDRTFLKNNAGKPIRFRLHDGYQTFKIGNQERKAHQWAWLYTNGELPAEGLVIDHIDRNPTNNAIKNLRAVSRAENNRNIQNYNPTVKKGATPIKNGFPKTSEVQAVFNYDSSKGEIYWRPREGEKPSDKRFNKMYAGKRAGRYTKDQPVLIRFNGLRYTAQELIWSYLGRPKPEHGLLCISRDKHDLRIDNWREATPKEDYFQNEKDAVKKQIILKKLINYDPETGVVTLKQRALERTCDVAFNKRHRNIKPAGFRRNRYHYCTILGKDYHSSHLAWLYQHGVWPPDTGLEIDHINRDSLDNRIENLRLVSHSANMANISLLKNNTSGHAGVVKDSQRKGKWRAYHLRKTIGVFASKEQAIEARQQAENMLVDT